jgi:hypothetical protein
MLAHAPIQLGHAVLFLRSAEVRAVSKNHSQEKYRP